MREQPSRVPLGLILLFVGLPLFGQPKSDARGPRILSFQENDRDGRERVLTVARPIVDINSGVTIFIDRAALRDQTLSPADPELVDAAIARANLLGSVAKQGEQSLDRLATALASWRVTTTPDDPRALKRLQEALAPTAGATLQIIRQAPLGSSLRARLNRSLESLETLPQGRGSQLEQFRAVFEAAKAEAAEVRTSAEKLAQKNGLYYVLGAWMVTAAGTAPIHIPGFDNYPPGERVEIARWVIALSDAQKEELKQLESNARAINETNGRVLELLEASAAQALRSLAETQLPCLEAVVKKIDALLTIGEERIRSVRNELEKAKAAVESYREFLGDLKDKYEGTTADGKSAAEFLIGTNEDIAAALSRTKALLEVLSALATLPEKMRDATASVRQAIQEVSQALNSCRDLFGAASTALADLTDLIGSALTGRKIAADLLEFGNAVLRFDLNSLPGEATFSLLNTGHRAAGDTLVVKIGTGRVDSKPTDLESYEFQILRLLSHIDTVVGLIFAHPSGESELKSYFQAAPSYSVLYKFRCQTAPCRKLWDPGVGLNVSALDFDHDDVPELGVGAVVSIVRDYVEAGFGLNVPRNQWFGFFGLRLPLPTFTLPAPAASGGAKE